MAHQYTSFDKIIKRVSMQTGTTIAECKEIYNAIIDEFVKQFQNENKIKISRLGTLSVDQYGYHYYPANYLMKERNEQY